MKPLISKYIQIAVGIKRDLNDAIVAARSRDDIYICFTYYRSLVSIIELLQAYKSANLFKTEHWSTFIRLQQDTRTIYEYIVGKCKMLGNRVFQDSSEDLFHDLILDVLPS